MDQDKVVAEEALGQAATASAIVPSPFLENLKRDRLDLQERIDSVDAMIKILESNMDVARAIDTLNRVNHR